MTTERTSTSGELAEFARLPGLTRLTLEVLLGPVAVALNEGAVYAADMNLCEPGSPSVAAAMHLIPLLCLLLAAGAGVAAHRDWNRLGRGDEDDAATVDGRSRFLAILGMGISALSAFLVLAQWLALVVFGPCVRA